MGKVLVPYETELRSKFPIFPLLFLVDHVRRRNGFSF